MVQNWGNIVGGTKVLLEDASAVDRKYIELLKLDYFIHNRILLNHEIINKKVV